MVKRVVIAGAVCLGLFAPAAVASAQTPASRPHSINAREHRQHLRIKDGVEDHDLTKVELNRLLRQEKALRAEEARYRRSGSGLNTAEYRDLQRDLDRLSKEIYRLKHNGHER
jgi:hypothetical protein